MRNHVNGHGKPGGRDVLRFDAGNGPLLRQNARRRVRGLLCGRGGNASNTNAFWASMTARTPPPSAGPTTAARRPDAERKAFPLRTRQSGNISGTAAPYAGRKRPVPTPINIARPARTSRGTVPLEIATTLTAPNRNRSAPIMTRVFSNLSARPPPTRKHKTPRSFSTTHNPKTMTFPAREKQRHKNNRKNPITNRAEKLPKPKAPKTLVLQSGRHPRRARLIFSSGTHKVFSPFPCPIDSNK